MKPRWKRWVLAGSCLTGTVAGVLAVVLWTCSPPEAELKASQTDPTHARAPTSRGDQTTLKVLSLNLAHGRGNGFHQALRKRTTIKSNLDDVAKVLRREGPHVVAFQEADGPSLWSGRFDHVEHLAETSGFPHFIRGEHVKGMKISYGTALLSQLPLKNSGSTTFAPSPPTLPKGYVVSTVSWPGKPRLKVDVVSVHLDFSRRTIRQKQIRQIIAGLAESRHPLVVMGDFNCQWSSKEGPLRTLAGELGLVAHKPTASGFSTFPKLGKRLDWVLVSEQLEFVKYQTLPDRVSDHRAVVAELRIAEAGN